MRTLQTLFSDLDASALTAWTGICDDPGYDPTCWTLSVLSRRDDPDIARIVLCATHRDGRTVGCGQA
ncbi:hypothetical protein [Jannaschia rubra]|uniref:hypothetical protein n=1 Tax=Jannaschia rubra TaxID=282197 RepID=UPI0006E130E6|nr:hypothetical protein [Jannaschia rubra]